MCFVVAVVVVNVVNVVVVIVVVVVVVVNILLMLTPRGFCCGTLRYAHEACNGKKVYNLHGNLA